MILSNVHTHCTLCDGASTPDEVAKAAIALGFTDIGFSSHGPAPFDKSCPGVASEKAYIDEIACIRDRYRGVLGVSIGLEQDTYGPAKEKTYDYTIGSNHYLPVKDGRYIAVDAGHQILKDEIDNRYSGNGLAMARDYYGLFLEGLKTMQPSIVGHFDLVKKYNRGNTLFDEASSAYRQLALEALDEALNIVTPYGGMLEVNTGAIIRGLRDDPYPSQFLLRRAAEKKARMIITSDSHDASTLNLFFDMAQQQLKLAGFTKVAVLFKGEFVDMIL